MQRVADDIPNNVFTLLSSINYKIITSEEWSGIYAIYNDYKNNIPLKSKIILGNRTIDAPKEFAKLINAIDYNKISPIVLKFVVAYLNTHLSKYILK